MTSTIDFFHFLAGALDALRVEVPPAYAGWCQALHGKNVCIEVDGASRYLSIANDRHDLWSDGAAHAELHVKTTRAALLELLDAQLTLRASVLSDALSLRGSPQDLVNLEQALFAFVQGAARSPRARALLTSYLDETERTPATSTGTAVHFDRKPA